MSNDCCVVRVRHLQSVEDLSFRPEEVETATLSSLREKIAERFSIPPPKQRLLIPALKKNADDDRRLLKDIPGLLVSSSERKATMVASVMVIGTAERHIVQQEPCAGVSQSFASSKSVLSKAELAHIVGISHNEPDGIYTCSFASAGYALQPAYYCRTCADNGHAEAQHWICFSCTARCHKDHDTEMWGMHPYMRCDCCTIRTQCTSESTRCSFIRDERIDDVPRLPLPANALNRYPSRTDTWCLCKPDDTLLERNDDEGLSCMLCFNCFYAPHVTRLCTQLFLGSVWCYAETSGCDTIAYRCRTCSASASWQHVSEGCLVCPPCRLECHDGHEFDDVPVHIRGNNNGESFDPDGLCSLSCGCRAGCNIAHSIVSMDSSRRATLRLPQGIANVLIEEDELCAFACGECMQKYPWLWEKGGEGLRKCHKGVLPSSNCASLLPLPRCGAGDADVLSSEQPTFPFHGMVIPEDLAKFACTCALCQAAWAAFVPRRDVYHILQSEPTLPSSNNGGSVDTELGRLFGRHAEGNGPVPMFVAYHNDCDNCGEEVDRHEGHICVPCELANRFYLVCRSCYSNDAAIEEHRNKCHKEKSLAEVRSQLLQDTAENLWGVLGVYLAGSMNTEAKQWLTEHWNDEAVREALLAFAGRPFDPTPCQPTDEKEEESDPSEPNASNRKRPRDE